MRLIFTSDLLAGRQQVWDAVSSMQGVNDELRPLLRMSRPGGVDRLDAATLEGLGNQRPVSWVLLAGFVPLDRHRFGFDRVTDGEGFAESSSSWINREWRHTRTIGDGVRPGQVTVRDELEIRPRLRVMAPVIRVGVAAIFRQRHRRLRRRFGSLG